MTEKKSSFAGNMLKLTSGTVLAQVISTVSTPLIARLFSPEAFGIATLFASVSSVITVVVCLRYDRSIIIPPNDDEAVNLVGVSLGFALLTTLLAALLVWTGGTTISGWMKSPRLKDYLWLLPISLLLWGILAALSSWHTRKGNFGWMTIAQLANSICYVGVAIAAGFGGHTTGAYLIYASLMGSAAWATILCVITWRQYSSVVRQYLSRAGMLAALKRHQRFPKYGTFSGIITYLSAELPVFFLSAFFSAGVVGQFGLGNRLIRVPMSLIGVNVSRVFSQYGAKAKNEGGLAKVIEDTFGYLVTLSLFPFAILALAGKDLFVLVFGQTWAEAGVYSQILSIWGLFWFITTSISVALDVLEEQALELRINVLILVTRGVSLLIGGLLHDARIALGLFSGSGILVYAYYCYIVLKQCGVPPRRFFRILLSKSLLFAPAGVVIGALKLFGTSPLTVVVACVVLAALYYSSVIHIDPVARGAMSAMFARSMRRAKSPA